MPTPSPNIFLYQIFYDDASRSTLDPGFIPLDNTQNERPDWYEFWVIRNYLLQQDLEEDAWYGFFSPKFGIKTGLKAEDINNFIAANNEPADVALISFAWDQISYFSNPFEQGEIWHPGIMQLSQRLCDRLGLGIDLGKIVSHTGNFTFSNFIIGTPRYWMKWLKIADDIFDYIENEIDDLAIELSDYTQYGSSENRAPVKTFIQERIPAIILSQGDLRITSMNTSHYLPIFEAVFDEDIYTRGLLQTCDLLKRQYCETADEKKMQLYVEIRNLIRRRR